MKAGEKFLRLPLSFDRINMSLKNRIRRELPDALKSKNKIRLETLRMLMAALTEKEIEVKARERDLTPDEELSVLTNAAKKRREAIEMFGKGNRPDLVESEKAELAVIDEFLPKMMSENEISDVVTKIAAELGTTRATDFGKLMQAVMKEVKGKADGRLVQEIVKKALATE
jgi:uncharacterized protein YqeY